MTAEDTAGAPDASPDHPQDPAEWGTPEGRRMIGLLWDPPVPGSRGPRQKLSVPEIVAAAVTLADADGFEALSMRGLAKHLGTSPMSLYTYVPGKAELFELMIDAAYADRELPDRSLPWREQFRVHARQGLAMYRSHPWLVHANLWRLPLGPHVLDVSEDMLRIGAAIGLIPDHVVRVSSLLESYLFGIARGELADRAEAVRTGQSSDAYWDARASFWGTHFDPVRFPTMLANYEAGAYDESHPPDEDFDFALDLMLDGVERLIPRPDPADGG